MTQLIGNVTKDATVRIVNHKQVINFTIAINYEYYKAGEVVKLVSFIDCQYWTKFGGEDQITKGREIVVMGRLYSNAYQNASGEMKAVTRFKVDKVFVAVSKPTDQSNEQTNIDTPGNEDEIEPEAIADLPF